MDAFINLLIHYGGAGMFVAAFLAGSFFPFSSEVVCSQQEPMRVNFSFGAQQETHSVRSSTMA